MNVRDYYSTLGIAAVVIVLVLLIGGVVAIGYVTLNDVTEQSTIDNTDPNIAVPTDSDELPPGYTPTSINSSVAIQTHTFALMNRKHTMRRIKQTPDNTEIQTKLLVSPNATVQGNRTVTATNTNSTRQRISSPDGQTYVIAHKENGSEIRTFADSSYATGNNLIRQVVTNDNIGLRNIDRSKPPTTYQYYYRTDESRGGILVNERGIITRVYRITSADGAPIREGMQIGY